MVLGRNERGPTVALLLAKNDWIDEFLDNMRCLEAYGICEVTYDSLGDHFLYDKKHEKERRKLIF